jgi:hypothetical protein
MAGILCLALLFLLSPFTSQSAAQMLRGTRVGQVGGPHTDYDAGYAQGLRQGAQDGRRGREFDLPRAPVFSRSDDFRRGFADGYRAGYERFRMQAARQLSDRRDGFGRRAPGGYREPASARGYSDGYEVGLNDGRRGNRYDPVASRNYRDGDNGYFGSYGSRDAYRDNYRAGFRQGYEEGYRDAGRNRRSRN